MANEYWFSNGNDSQFWEPGHGLGRRISKEIPFRRMSSSPAAFLTPALKVNKRLDLPREYLPRYDQGQEGACVGFAWSWAMSILNRRFYAARKLYIEAQHRDQYADTPPEEGTDVVAGAQVLMEQGHWRFARGVTFPLAAFEGISNFSQAKTVDEIRLAISLNTPVVLGINWYSDFDMPRWIDIGAGGKRWWIGHPGLLDVNSPYLGAIRGGHAICCCGARDDIEAVALVNSWGTNYPGVVEMPYKVLQRLLNEDGEAIIPTDRT